MTFIHGYIEQLALAGITADSFDVCMSNVRHTLQHTATHCSTLQHAATHCSTLQHTVAHSNTLQYATAHLQHYARQLAGISDDSFYVCMSNVRHTLHHTATYCNTLQHTATHCNTLRASLLASALTLLMSV